MGAGEVAPSYGQRRQAGLYWAVIRMRGDR